MEEYLEIYEELAGEVKEGFLAISVKPIP